MDLKKRSRLMQQFIFVGPTSLFFFVIVLIPFFLGLYYSFTSWNGISRHVEWTGLRNYIHIFTKDPSFLNSFWFTARFTFFGLVLTNLLGFMLCLRAICCGQCFLSPMSLAACCWGSSGSLSLLEDSPRWGRLPAGLSSICLGSARELHRFGPL